MCPWGEGCSLTFFFLMVVNDLHLAGIIIPDETDPPLVIDADAPLPGPVVLQRLQAVPGWYQKILKASGLIQIVQLPACRLEYVRREGRGRLALENSFGVPVTQAADHGSCYMP